MIGCDQYQAGLKAGCTPGSQIGPGEQAALRLQLPSGGGRRYRLAQLDDYQALPRDKFRWQPGCSFQLNARSSEREIPGTWGFGFWNDPFSMGILGASGRARWPVLPQTAWFFFASPPNYLSIHDDLPGSGYLAMTYATCGSSNKVAYLGAPGLPFLAIRPVARWARRLLSRMVKQDACRLEIDPTGWHSYSIHWEKDKVVFRIDHQAVFETPVSPEGSLGFVLWIDNQYAAFTPEGRLGYGFLAHTQSAWIEVSDLIVERR